MRKESRLFKFPGESEFEYCWSARDMWDHGIDLDGEIPPRGCAQREALIIYKGMDGML